ncbi:hypothetical protein COCSUDRAFT_56332 [Coccomyxa subellipsoidea C-169]|uniref:Protein kinase domain-containing protein n=1 Tax=Coccomyxa subellipsoidea (strain C-169) TaxID=574566 RepID=I0YU16_COCSC|nr:hypothetical protein COCSUDRAFT_56332 [Coccomyxa subellipsoidea C-169]EIE21885.1 hypothetical protein COCSUDRAFT_56332 [Coccomyxa subellipsoidea C-169]|eukprot:XP_005646429.1 hypothetical protein COCSUDRAFT_56332 [Coccomyxa subellipsoidea C-169]
MQAPTDGLEGLVAHSVRELESMSRDDVRNNHSDQDLDLERCAKVPKTGSEPVKSGLRHVQTEQRRRDRINEGFAALKALMPGQEKMDKATFLNSTVEYIKQLQGVMQQLVTLGVVSKLPEEAQWNIRVLLPRKNELTVAPFTVPAARATAPPAAPAVDPAATTAALLGMLLTQSNQLSVAPQQGQAGLDIAQLVQQAAYSQQLQAQQSQLLQALQMQHLFQAANTSNGMPVENMGAPATGAMPNVGQFMPSNSMPQVMLMPPMTVGCNQGAPASVMPKARKNGKVRRHTTAARIAKPAPEMDAPAMDVGRPAPTEAPLAAASRTNGAGGPGDFSDIPIFFAKIGVFSNNATVNTWRLGWSFTAGETVQGGNIYTAGVDVLKLNGSSVQLESLSPNNTVKPFSWTSVSFLGTKAAMPTLSAPYRVAPINDVAFNNLVCAQLPLQPQGGSPASAPSAAPEQVAQAGKNLITKPSPLYVEYAPVVYLQNQDQSGSSWQSDINSLITFLVRVANLGQDGSIDAGRIKLQYWFNGPSDIPDAADPLSQFTMNCLDTTTTCGDLTYNITTGLPNVNGARYVLNLGFKTGAAVLLNETETSVRDQTTESGGRGSGAPKVSVYEALLRIESRQFLREMNASSDYSYLDTPRSSAPISNTTNIVPRLAEPNTHIPAFLDNGIAWGGQPVAVAVAGANAEPPMPTPSSINSVACVGGVCGLSTLYCCYTVDNKPVAADIPDVWPPVATPVPAALRGANLNCASGNCTEGAPSPSPAVPSPTPSAPAPLPEASSAPATAPSPAVLGPGASIGQRLAEAEPGLGAPVAPATAAAPVPPFAPGPGPVTSVPAAQKSSASISSGFCALYLIIWRHRRRKLRSLDSKSSPRDPGSPHSGLPIALRPPYKQGSADSQEPFLDGRRRTAALVPWRKSKAGQDLHNAPQLALRPHGPPADISEELAASKAASPAMELHAGAVGSPKQQHVHHAPHRLLSGLADLPGAGHIQAAGHLPMRLLRGGNARDAAVGGAAVQRWMGEAQLAQRGETSSAYGGASPVTRAPYGYIANSPSDLLLFTNPLVQGTLPNDWEDRYRSAVVSDWAGSPRGDGSMRGRQSPNLIGDMLGHRRTPRWLGDPYGLDVNGHAVASPDRHNLPKIAASLGRHVPALTYGWQRENGGIGHPANRSVQTAPNLSSGDDSSMSMDWAAEEGTDSGKVGLRRVKSWTGAVQQIPDDMRGEDLPLDRRRLRRAMSSAANLPPLAALPPPISMGIPPPANIDMDVDFEAEIKPHLRTCLGQGGFGTVFEATWRGKRVAVKVLQGLDGGGKTVHFEALRREVQLASRFNSERLVQVYGASLRDPASACLVMELVQGGNLHQRIYNTSQPRLSHLEILQIAHDVAEGLAYMHPSVIHRDLKPQNILIDGAGRVKIADFGISRVKDPAKTFLSTTNVNGTPQYMAPEQFAGARCDEKVDVYALGTILNECATRRPPWREFNNAFQIIVQVAIKAARPAMDASFSEPLRRLIAKCWAQDPRARPSCYEIMRLTEILLAQAKRRSEHGAAQQIAQQSDREAQPCPAKEKPKHLRRASSEGGAS